MTERAGRIGPALFLLWPVMVAIVDVAMLDELLDAHLACPGVLDDEVNSFACAQTRYHRKISLNLSDT